MADAATETDAAVNRAQRGKITLKELGEPAKVKLMSVEQMKAAGNKYVLGHILGVCRGTVERTDEKSGDKYEGLLGTFRTMPLDPDYVSIESGVLFLPDAFHNIVVQSLNDAKKQNPDDPSIVVDFGVEVASIAAKNPAGYSWQFTPITKPVGRDPLSHLTTQLLEHKKNAPKQLAAPKR